MSLRLCAFALIASLISLPAFAEPSATNDLSTQISNPLSLTDCVNLALENNGDIQRGRSDLEAQYGVVVQTRAIVLPKVTATGDYEDTSEIQNFPFPGVTVPNQNWNLDIQLTQSIYEGGRITSSLRSARLTRDQAVLQYQTVIADALLNLRVAYYDVLLAAEQIVVNEASVKLLTQQVDDQTRRYNAGTVPRFNVLQAEVQLANERPALIQARNAYRIAKNTLVNTLGWHVPSQIWEDIPLQLTDHLDSEPYPIQLPVAIAKALENRSELAASQKAQALSQEQLKSAKSGYKPSAQAFAGYGGRNSQFNDDPGDGFSGWTVGVQFNWSIFDGLLTQGKIDQAKAQFDGSKVDVDNLERNIELEVRTDYSNFIEAREVLESQKKVQEEAEEALRLATARNDAGTGTQLDVLTAQTDLTQARSTQAQALHDYDVARARLERAIGENLWGGQPDKK